MKSVLEKNLVIPIKKDLEEFYENLLEDIFIDNVSSLKKEKINEIYEEIISNFTKHINSIFDENKSPIHLKRKIDSYKKLKELSTIKDCSRFFDFLSHSAKSLNSFNTEEEEKNFFSTLFSDRSSLEKDIKNFVKEEVHEIIVMTLLKKIKKENSSLRNKDLEIYSWLKKDLTKDFPKEIELRTSNKNSIWNDFHNCDEVHFESIPSFSERHKKIFSAIDLHLITLENSLSNHITKYDLSINRLLTETSKSDILNIVEKELLLLINNKIESKIDSLMKNKTYSTEEKELDSSFFDITLFRFKLSFFKNINISLKTVYNNFSNEDEFFTEYMAEKDFFNIHEILNAYQNKTVSELINSSNNSSEINLINNSSNRFSSLLNEKRENLKIWMKEVIGDSVFEKYKSNNPSKIIIHVGDTNVGKTYAAIDSLKKASSGMYLAPLRLLALEIFEKLNEENIPCSYITGEERKRIDNSNHFSCTIEMADLKNEYDVVVIDESQMISDFERGGSWVRAILGVKAKEIHIITSPSALKIITEILDDKNIEVRKYERRTPLIINPENRPFDTIKKGDALILFSRKKVLETAKELENKNLRPAIIYGSMPPSVRRKQLDLFKSGKYDVVVATDAIGMGVNLPIEHVFFLDNKKFDGENLRLLSSSELKQIAGRAGRFGIHEKGYVSFLKNSQQMTNLLNKETTPLSKVCIKPNYKMFETYIEKIKKNNLLESLESFLANWEIYEPKEDFVEIQKTKKERIKLKSIIDNNIVINDPKLLWEFIQINFDESEPSLEKLWINNIKCISENKTLKILEFNSKKNLETQELEYKKLDLQLQFEEEHSEIFEFYQWKKEEISDTIFDILKNSFNSPAKKCTKCRKFLKKNEISNICPSCSKPKILKNKNRN